MEQQENNKDVASLVLGIISCALVLLGVIGAFFGLVTGILAIVFSVRKNKIDKENKSKKTSMRKAGFVLGIIGTALNAVILIIIMIILVTVLAAVSSMGATVA